MTFFNRGETLHEVIVHLVAEVGINFHQLFDEDIREKCRLADSSVPANRNIIKEKFMDEYEKCASLTKDAMEKLLQKGQGLLTSIHECSNIVNKRFVSVILHMSSGIVNLGLPRTISTLPAEKCAETLYQKLGDFGLKSTYC